MTPWRTIAIGLGGGAAVLAAGAVGNLLGNIVFANGLALLVLLLGFLFIAAVGVGRLVRGESAERST